MRREFTRKTKAAAYERSGGNCEKCGAPFGGRRPEYDHVIPDWMGGEPTLENCEVLCPPCHRGKTTKDQGAIAKTRRTRDKNTGAFVRKHPMPGSRNSLWRKKLSGEVVRR